MTALAQLQHTPGPWTVESHPTEYPDLRIYSVLAPRGWQEANGSYRRCSVAQGLDSEANARLIAAAPDLLAALTLAHELLTGLPLNRSTIEGANPLDQAALTYIRAVLAAAEGTAP